MGKRWEDLETQSQNPSCQASLNIEILLSFLKKKKKKKWSLGKKHEGQRKAGSFGMRELCPDISSTTSLPQLYRRPDTARAKFTASCFISEDKGS